VGGAVSRRCSIPSAIDAISSNPRQNTPCLSVPVRLNGRREVRDAIARPGCSTEGAYRHARNTDDIFHARRQHCGADVAVQRSIARSRPTCARTVGTHVGAPAISRVTTELRLRGASRRVQVIQVSNRRAPIPSINADSLTARARRLDGRHHSRRFALWIAVPERQFAPSPST
jgi:hypothetical protein